jgi:peptidyl-tRNA hydrolase, PTH1 family
MKYLIAGLGNTSSEYELTRHNIGFLALDALAEAFEVTFKVERLASVAEFKVKGRQICLIKPSTYMNLSGKAVNYWLQNLKIPTENFLAITDDVALPFGKLRIRSKGSNGGHNGLGDIEKTLETQEYARMRFGIGNDYPKGQQAEYVLGRFSQTEFEAMPDIFKKTSDAVVTFCLMGITKAMNEFNK